jgi:hypothetical protein
MWGHFQSDTFSKMIRQKQMLLHLRKTIRFCFSYEQSMDAVYCCWPLQLHQGMNPGAQVINCYLLSAAEEC